MLLLTKFSPPSTLMVLSGTKLTSSFLSLTALRKSKSVWSLKMIRSWLTISSIKFSLGRIKSNLLIFLTCKRSEKIIRYKTTLNTHKLYPFMYCLCAQDYLFSILNHSSIHSLSFFKNEIKISNWVFLLL